MPLATDWDRYYDRPLATAKLTRRYTGHWLQTAIRKFAAGKDRLSVIEFGGGNSCFFEPLVTTLPIARYDVVDLNEKSSSTVRGAGAQVSIRRDECASRRSSEGDPGACSGRCRIFGWLDRAFHAGADAKGREESLLVREAGRSCHHHGSDADLALSSDALRGRADRGLAISGRATVAFGGNHQRRRWTWHSQAVEHSMASCADPTGGGLAGA